MLAPTLPESSARILERYDHFRRIMCHFQSIIPDQLDKNHIKEAAKLLHLWHNGAILMDDANASAALVDFAMYALVDENRETAVVRYLREHPPRIGSDEDVVLTAMAESRHCLLQVRRQVPGVGAECFDQLRGRHHLVANRGFGKTAEPGMIFASRLLSIPGFEMSTGADLPVDDETHSYLIGFINKTARKTRVGTEVFNDAGAMESVSSLIIGACLDSGSSRRVVYLNSPRDVRKEMTTPAQRNRPCPCGSGLKYKRCCGELVRH